MDPDTCLRQIIEDIENGDREEAREGIANLINWMRKRGFAPQVRFDQLEFLLSELSDRLK